MRLTKLVILAGAMLAATHAWAQGYPNKSVRVIVPFSAGGATDIVTRIVGQKLGEIWGQQVLVVTLTFPPKTVKDFIALAKARPKEIAFGSAGFSTQTHLAAENYIYTARIDVVHVPYKGEAPAIVDVMAGQVQFATPNLAAAINFIQQEKLRALGVTSKQRSTQLPNVPAIAETLPGFDNLGWFGLMAPAGTPREIIDKFYRDTAKALEAADIKTRFDGLGMATARPSSRTRYARRQSAGRRLCVSASCRWNDTKRET